MANKIDNQNARKFQVPHRIRFSECDPAGIVFYPQYFVLFNDLMEAWVDDILEMGFTGYILDQRWGLPTVQLEAEFRSVSRMGDDVVLTLQVEHVGNRSLILGLDCTGVAGDLRMRVKQTIVTTDLKTHRSIPIPAPLRVALGDDPAGKPRP